MGQTGSRREGSSQDPPRSERVAVVSPVLRSRTVSAMGLVLPAVGACESGHGRSKWSGDTGPARAAPSGIRLRGLSQGWPSTGAAG